MGLRIQTNVQSLNAQRNLTTATEQNSQTMEKLSSGFRINKSSDDAAGLAISEKMKADIRGLNTAKRNASDGISVVQVAEGAMNEIGNILSRLRELSVQSASDTIGNNERQFIHREFVALKDEIDRISMSTEYNGTFLLVGQKLNDDSVVPEQIKGRSNSFPLEIQVGKNWQSAVDGADAAENYARNPVNVIRINLNNIDTTTDGLGLGAGNLDTIESTGVFMADNLDQSKERAQKSISTIDEAINKVAGYRADLGAIQSRLSSTINNLGIQSENYSQANSRIRDADFADETARMTQTNIIKQAGVAILSQANQNPQAALRLLS